MSESIERGGRGRSARVSPEVAKLEARLEALGDWRAQLDEELAEMSATTKRIQQLIKENRGK